MARWFGKDAWFSVILNTIKHRGVYIMASLYVASVVLVLVAGTVCQSVSPLDLLCFLEGSNSVCGENILKTAKVTERYILWCYFYGCDY